MNSEKIKWCLKQSKGIKLAEKNENISSSYMKSSEEDFENIYVSKGKWKNISAYYACYEAFYSILIQCGIESEIHDCSLSLFNLFDFDDEDKEFILLLKKERINVQYYLKEPNPVDIEKVKKFILKCKVIINSLTSIKIEEIRKKVSRLK